MITIYIGFCYTENSEQMEMEELKGDTEAYQYACKHQLTYPRVSIIEKQSEFVVLEVRDGNIIFPEELQGKEPWKNNE